MALTKVFTTVVLAVLLSVTSAAPADAVEATRPKPFAAPFAINIGSHASDGNVIAWESSPSVDRCSQYGVVAPIGVNFCDRPFTLPTRPGSYVVHGCGGHLTITANTGYFADCASFTEPATCGVVTYWHCV